MSEKYYLSKLCPHWDKKRNNRFKYHRYTSKKLEVYDGEKREWVESANRNIPARRDMTPEEIMMTTQKALL